MEAVGGLHHITLRVTDLERSTIFYQEVLGFDVEGLSDCCRFWVGGTRVILRSPLPGTPKGDRFSERRIGLDHIAFAVQDRGELEEKLQLLSASGIQTQGIQRFVDDTNPGNDREFVCFRDPDNIQLEFYTR